jgi:DNA-binding protein H-NS
MPIDIETLSPRELDALVAAAEKRKAFLSRRRRIGVVRAELNSLAAMHGYTIEELFGAHLPDVVPAKSRAGQKRNKVAAKYRDPQNKRNTWSGRGRMPRWLAAKTRQGHSAADFLVPGIARATANVSAIGKRTVFKAG